MDKVCEGKIQPFIDQSYRDLATYVNAFAQKMQMKREALADKGIWTAKKRYVLNVYNNEGVEYAKPHIKVMGLEMIKSSTPSACREKLWEAIDIILNKDEDALIEFINKFRDEFRALPATEIAFPRGVNGIGKKFDKKTKQILKGAPIHVRGSILYNLLVDKFKLSKVHPHINEGDKIKFIYLQPNPFQSHVISFPQGLPKEFKLDAYIDHDVQFEKSFLEPLRIILDCIGWQTEKKSTLDDFFS